MSNLLCHTCGMRFKKAIDLKLDKTNETLGFLGQTQLLRRHDGLYELVGGTEEEQAAARNWCRHFAPQVKFGPCGELREFTFYIVPPRKRRKVGRTPAANWLAFSF